MRLVQTAKNYGSADGGCPSFADALFRILVQPGQAQKGRRMSSLLRESLTMKSTNECGVATARETTNENKARAEKSTE